MSNLQETINALLDSVDHLMEELQKDKTPYAVVIRNFLKRMEKYPLFEDTAIDVYERTLEYHIFLHKRWFEHRDTTGLLGMHQECVILVNNSHWNIASIRKQAIIAHAIPKLIEAFINNVKEQHNANINLEYVSPMKKKWWKKW